MTPVPKPHFLVKVRKLPVRITAGYAVLGGFWILFSDSLLYMLVKDPQLLFRIAALKGWLFVAITSAFLSLLLTRNSAAIEKAYLQQGESEERYRAMFRAAPFSIWEIDLSPVTKNLQHLSRRGITDFSQFMASNPEFVTRVLNELSIHSVNQKTLEMFGAQSQEQLLQALGTVLKPESLQVLYDGIVAMSQGKDHFEAETTIATLRGESRSVLVSLTLDWDQPHFTHVPLNLIDITERKQTEEMLRLFELAIQQIEEAITITTAALDAPGPQIVYVNPAFTLMTGYRSDEVVGLTPRILQGPKTDRAVLDRLRQTLWQRQTFHGQAINYRKDGSEFLMDWYVVPLINRQFQVTHFVAVQRDITAQKGTEADLKRTVEDLQRRLADRRT